LIVLYDEILPSNKNSNKLVNSLKITRDIANIIPMEKNIIIVVLMDTYFEINRDFRDSGIKVLGQENVIELQKPSLGAEDFAEFLNEIPGAMFRLGVSSSNGCAPLHSSKFDPDERAIAIGIKVITESIVKLNNEKINTIGT